jgi:hypothetical protein
MRQSSLLLAFLALAGLAAPAAHAQYGGYGGYDGYDRDVRCESRDGRTARCHTGGGRAYLVRQLSDSPCVRGRTWGSDRGGIWVSSGCRAVFRIDDGYGYGGGYDGGYGGGYGYGNGYGNDIVRCESRDNRSRTCSLNVGRRGDVRLVRQLSDTPCIEGQTWGQSRNGVWVTRGCRAEFVVARRGGGYGPPPGYPRPGERPPGDLGG